MELMLHLAPTPFTSAVPFRGHFSTIVEFSDISDRYISEYGIRQSYSVYYCIYFHFLLEGQNQKKCWKALLHFHYSFLITPFDTITTVLSRGHHFKLFSWLASFYYQYYWFCLMVAFKTEHQFQWPLKLKSFRDKHRNRLGEISHGY